MTRTPHVIFVCWGNICRSPIGERVARKYLADAGVDARVTSAGVGDDEVGNPMDRRARRVLEAHGYDASGHVAHQIDVEELRAADLVLAAEPDHVDMMQQMAPEADHIHLLRDHDPSVPPGTSLPDPWYGSSEGFKETLAAVEAAMPGIVSAVRQLTD